MRHEQGIDQRHAVAQHRMVRQMRASDARRRPFYAQPMAAVGRRLARWGCRLEARYGAVESPARMQARIA